MNKEKVKLLQNYLQNYFLELNTGFALAFKDQNMNFPIGRRKIDLVFYQIKIKALIILKIKSRKIVPQDLKDFSLLIDNFEKIHRYKDDNPSIGILLGIKDKYIKVKYVFTEEFFDGYQEKYLEYLPSERELEKVTGNFFPETKYFEEFLKGIVDVIKTTQDKIFQFLPDIEANVDYMIRNKSKDVNKIETALDTLMDLSMIMNVRGIFDRLISYYYTIQPVSARSYEEMYQDFSVGTDDIEF